MEKKVCRRLSIPICLLLGGMWGAGCAPATPTPSLPATTPTASTIPPTPATVPVLPTRTETAAPHLPRLTLSVDMPAPTRTPTPSVPSPKPATPLPVDLQGRIVYVAYYKGKEEIYVMDADGTDKTCLTCNQEVMGRYEKKSDPLWSPDGTKIVFACRGHLYVMDADGSDLLFLGPGFCPTWFSDGNRLLFVSLFDRVTWVAQADGTRLFSLPFSGFYPDLSPDETRIIHVRYDADARFSSLFMTNLDTGEEVLVVEGVDFDNPTWLADGKRVVYIDARIDDEPSVYVVDVETGEEIRLTNASGGWLAVSPDKSKIAFTCWDDKEEWPGICVINADGSGRTVLPVTLHHIFLFSLSWSPDGNWIVFSGKERSEDSVNIHIIAADGSAFFRLTDDGTEEADWGP